jgi:hypothetical protein
MAISSKPTSGQRRQKFVPGHNFRVARHPGAIRQLKIQTLQIPTGPDQSRQAEDSSGKESPSPGTHVYLGAFS